MFRLSRAAVYVIGVLSGSNGHLLFLRDWPDAWLNAEMEEEECAFCASRGLKHDTW